VLAAAVAIPAGSTTLRAGSATQFDTPVTPSGLTPALRVAPPAPQIERVSMPDAITEVIRLTNIERAEVGLGPLTAHPLLAQSAAAHANDQAEVPCKVGYLSHTGSDGSSALDRIQRTGLNISRWAENIACLYETPAGVVNGWMRSPGHRAIILDPFLTHIGVAIAESSTGQRYWVQDFATLR